MSDTNFEIPNRYGAVVNLLPILSSVLVSFSGAYFIGVTVSDADILTSNYAALKDCIRLTSLTKQVVIQFFSVLACFFLFLSLVFAFNVQAYTYVRENYNGDTSNEESFKRLKVYWENKRNSNASKAYVFFHLALPILALSIVALLDGWLLIAAIIAIILGVLYIIFG
jgi:hypothetical protein